MKTEFTRILYGTILCILISAAGLFLSKYIPVGSVTLSILIGIVIGNTLKPGDKFRPGIAFSEKIILACAIALMGVDLDFTILQKLGYGSILLIVTAIPLTIASALLLGKAFRFNAKFSLLLGIGNGICGSSAIGAAKQIIGADEEEAGLSVAVVNSLGTIGIFLLPLIATRGIHLTDINSGLLIGNTLQAVGQVMAAALSISDSAAQTAVIVKMTRILMLTPIIFILIVTFRKNETEYANGTKPGKVKIPLFIIGFFLCSLIPTFGLLPEKAIALISRTGKYALITAMAGIGLKITFSSILKDGKKALLIGGLVWTIQIAFSTAMVYTFFR